MLRNVVLVRLKAGTPEERTTELESALRAIDFPDRTNFVVGRDAGLRDGNMDLALLADFPDGESYRRFDANAEHNRIRRELIAPMADSVERCQYRY